MNINVLYIYPKIIEINKEINLFRIIDNNIKESLVFYSIKNSTYKVFVINTLVGDTKKVKELDNIDELDKFIEEIKKLECDIISLPNLEEIEKYILNLDLK